MPLAQVNIARMLAPLESETMAGFVARLDEINAVADRAPGFVWRLQEDGDATSLRPFDDDRILVNMSVWESLEALRQYVYSSAHVEVLRQRASWFSRLERAFAALWWVPAGHVPTVEEAKARLAFLDAHGPTPWAFTFKAPFPEDAVPADPIAAVRHPDPYPYYLGLAATGFHRNPALGLWVAPDPASVEVVLQDERCRVRPPDEPVPGALQGTAAGALFGQLVRMNDGARHASLKPAVAARLGAIDRNALRSQARASAAVLRGRFEPAGDLGGFAFHMPVHVVASLLGIEAPQLDATAADVAQLVAGFAPGADASRVGLASVAAGRLLATLRRPADDDATAANAVGFLTQGYEATAGLIGNAWLAVQRDAARREALVADATGIVALLRDVVRLDPPVQNTRRFLAEDATLFGQTLRRGDAILVVLAAANRNPEARSFTFGAARHACPGEEIAVAIAAAALEVLLAWNPRVPEPVRYRASVNARLPVLS